MIIFFLGNKNERLIITKNRNIKKKNLNFSITIIHVINNSIFRPFI